MRPLHSSISVAAPSLEGARSAEADRVLRIASFNIQTGISTSRYREYVTGGWRHVFPTSKRLPNLERIAHLLRGYDLVGLQEADAGGTRGHRIVQTEYLAHRAGFPHWHHQINRRFGEVALHSNGLLSRFRADAVEDYKLPGLPGRGVMLARYGKDPVHSLYVAVAHLALTKRGRMKQFAFIADLIRNLPYVILMGDFNCQPDSMEFRYLLSCTGLSDPIRTVATFPSWRPEKMLDHVLITPCLQAIKIAAVDFPCSDHLPIALHVALPAAVAANIPHRAEERAAAVPA
jgi:endonuclease/exonuclease/phosphatase family metal-dependent hydrolase